MKKVIERISKSFIDEAMSSPRMLEDLAAMEKYMSESYDGRTFVEILQNADDALASRVIVVQVESDLIIANDGRAFDENDITSICRSGASNKQRGVNIGYRGVGFKSATTISKEIIIFSNNVWFTFSKKLCAEMLNTDVESVPTVRIPLAYDESSLPTELDAKIQSLKDEGYTTFFLFKDALISKFKEELIGFDSGWLLFLRNLETVDIKMGNTTEKCQITRKALNNTDTIIKVLGKNQQWYIVTDENVSLGFAYSANKGIVPCEIMESTFHCFLPTIDKTGFPFKVNADFSTDPSRKHIIMDEISKKSLKRIENLFSKFLLRAVHGLNDNLISVISLLGTHTTLSEISVEFEKGILDLLSEEKWILLDDNEYVVPAKVRVLPSWMTNDEKRKIVATCEGIRSTTVSKIYFKVFPKIESMLLKQGAQELDSATLREILENPDDLSKLPISLQGKLFAYGCRGWMADQVCFDQVFIPLQQQYIRLEDIQKEANMNEEFLHTLKSLMGNLEIDALCELYPAFLVLKEKAIRKNSLKPKIPTLKKSTNNMAVNKWKTPIQNCMAVESLQGRTAVDVSKKSEEYDLICTDANGSKTYLFVKSVNKLGDSFKLSETEYASLERLGKECKIFVISTDDSDVNYIYIDNPVEGLSLERVVKEWEWICDSYEIPESVDNKLEVVDIELIKNVSKAFFNSEQRKYLEAIAVDGELTYDVKSKIVIEQINSIISFYNGTTLLKVNDEQVCVEQTKLSALRKILE